MPGGEIRGNRPRLTHQLCGRVARCLIGQAELHRHQPDFAIRGKQAANQQALLQCRRLEILRLMLIDLNTRTCQMPDINLVALCHDALKVGYRVDAFYIGHSPCPVGQFVDRRQFFRCKQIALRSSQDEQDAVFTSIFCFEIA